MPVKTLAEVLAGAGRWELFGEGAASNVCRFMLREQAKGRGASTTYVQSRTAEVVPDAEPPPPGLREYPFYARTNVSTAAGFAATLKFASLVVSHVCATTAWTTMKAGKVAKVVVPRVLFAYDARTPGFKTITDAMLVVRPRMQMDLDGEMSVPVGSAAIVEGSHCVGLVDMLQGKARVAPPRLDIRTHAMELGLLHAIDVAVGMGDRLQNPNAANVTLNPTTLQLVLIDIDTCLPPYPASSSVEAICQRSNYEDKLPHEGFAAWPFWPHQIPQ